MQKVTVVCLDDDQEAAVQKLQELGILHLKNRKPAPAAETLTVQRKMERFDAALSHLRGVKETVDAPADASLDADGIVAAVETAETTISSNQEQITALRRDLARLSPWGSFKLESVESLKRNGYQVILASALEDALPALPDGAILEEMSREGKTVYFVVIAPASVEIEVNEIPFPERSDAEALQKSLDAATGAIAAAEADIARLAPSLAVLENEKEKIQEELDFLRARDAMKDRKRLYWLTGFVPDKAMPALQEEAEKQGWALRYEDAELDDPNVPTFIDYDKMPAFFRLAKPVFDFIGIAPAYNETDVSLCVLIFLTIFFGMIVGDAGYGFLFLGSALFCKFRRPEKQNPLVLNLFLLFSAATIAWGWVNGTWFAIPKPSLPAIMRGSSWLDGANAQKHIQWICFLIAALHLSLARAWKAWQNRNLSALGHIGWGMLVWGNFFTAVELIVSSGSFPKVLGFGLYICGTVFILAFGVKWRDVGEVLNLPFSFINSFVDVLSYIRLFAVGLSSFYIAKSFNDMGAMVFKLSPWLLPATALIILFGHVLNIALGFMGVLVHGIRLNTLEFSNHMELTWSGRPYKPLKKAN